jgi:hypothetical protein
MAKVKLTEIQRKEYIWRIKDCVMNDSANCQEFIEHCIEAEVSRWDDEDIINWIDPE